jgi:hypothetical protein
MTQYPVSYVVHNTVNTVIAVMFDITWNQAVGEGTMTAPTVVSGRFVKTAGSTFLSLVEGSFVLRVVDANTTEFDLVEREDAVGQDEMSLGQFVRDFYASIVATVHGQPLPMY